MAAQDAADEQIDGKRITVTERFEKTRIALLSYSAVILLLSLAAQVQQPAPGGSSSAVVPALFTIPIDVQMARMLVWVAAFGYFLVFIIFDAPAARRTFAPILKGVTWRQLKDQLEQYECEVVAASAPALDLASEARKERDRIMHAIRDLDRTIGDRDLSGIEAQLRLWDAGQTVPFGDAKLDEMISTNPAKMFEFRLSNYPLFLVNHMELALAKLKELDQFQAGESGKSIVEALEASRDPVAKFARELRQFSDNVFDSEKRRFNLWEVGIPVTLFIVATAVLLWASIQYYSDGKPPAALVKQPTPSTQAAPASRSTALPAPIAAPAPPAPAPQPPAAHTAETPPPPRPASR